MGAFVIARLTFLEAGRRKILLAALVLGLIFLVVFGLGFNFILQEVRASAMYMGGASPVQLAEVSNFLMLAALYVVNFLTVMMTVLTSVDTLSGEIGSGTIHTLVSKPIRRWEIVTGKWLGFIGMVTLYLLLMVGGVAAIVYAVARYTPPHPVQAFGLLWLNAVLMLTVSLLGGTRLSTLANGVLVFGLFGVAFIGGWIEQIGALLTNWSAGHAAINIGIVTSLIMPSEALWRRAAFDMQTPLVASIGFSPFASQSTPSPLMIGYAIFYVLVAFWITVRQFQQRDL